MVIGVCTIELYLPTVHSLKEKRSIVKSVVNRVRNEFNVSIAEVDRQDAWQSAIIGVASVSNDTAYTHGQLTKVVAWIENQRLDAELVNYHIEML